MVFTAMVFIAMVVKWWRLVFIAMVVKWWRLCKVAVLRDRYTS